jgi:membrane protein YdbS with pleckstrin-like domain
LRASFALIFRVLAMRYIERILQPGETLVYSGKIHWVVYLPALALWAAAVAALLAGGLFPPILAIAALCAIVGFGVFFQAWFRRWTTEIDVTNRRVVYKRGFIKRHTVEMNMDKVESVDVDQSIFGRLLNYGDITIHGTGEGWETLHGIGAPLDFRNHVTAR